MRIISKSRIDRYYERPGRESSKNSLLTWHHTVKNAEWKNFADMRKDFNSVDSVGNQHYVFNIGGNNHRLVVVVQFTVKVVYIRWIGTHAEYDKIDCRTV